MAMRPEGGGSAALARAVRRVVALALLAAMGCADAAADDDALCGGALGACACGDTVVGDARLEGDVVCDVTRAACGVAGFRCTGLTIASGVTLDGHGFTLVGPPMPSAAGLVPEARRDALYGIEFPAGTHGARVVNLGARGFVRGVVSRTALRPDRGADDDVGGMNVIERCHVSGIGDRGIQISQARYDAVRDCTIEGSARENVRLLRGSAGNVLLRNRSVRAGTGAPNVVVEDAPRNLFTANAFTGSFLHVVGASDQNRFVANPLSGEGARIDLESDVEQATGRERAPRGNLVQLGSVARTGPASLPCVILDGATGTVFDTVSLHCGDAPPAPGEEPAQVLVARDNPDPADPDGPDLIVQLAPGVTVSPLVLEDRVCGAPAAARELP